MREILEKAPMSLRKLKLILRYLMMNGIKVR